MTNKELLNKYNTLVAKCKDMEEQFSIKDEQWKKVQAENDIIVDAARKLCEMILAKDKSEMNLGKGSGTWRALSTKALIDRATESYKVYNRNRSVSLRQLLDLAEDRQSIIEGLKDELDFYKNNGANPALYQKVKDEEKKEELVDQMDSQIKNAVESNNVDLIISDSDGVDQTMELLMGNDDIIQPTENSIPINEPQSKIAELRRQKQKKDIAKKYTTEINYSDVISRLSELQKDYIEILGSQGVSIGSELITVIDSKDKYKDKATRTLQNNCYTALKELERMNLISQTKIEMPIPPKNLSAIMLTEQGLFVYKLIFNKTAVLSEANRLIAEHDNLHHGYGIKAIYDELCKTNLYTDVDMNCRKNPLIVDPQKNAKITYIPDIFAIHKKTNQRCYFEYERGNTSSSDIIAKCNKMVKFTRNLYFVMNNGKSAEKIVKEISEWKKMIKKKNIDVYVYISTASFFQKQGFDVSNAWQYTFEPKDIEPKEVEE